MEEEFIISKIKNEHTRHYGFNLLLKAYQQRVYWHVRKMVIDHEDADDITQETFVKVWGKLDSFRGESSLFTWIYRIATNECLNFIKKKKRRAMFSFGDHTQELENKLTSDPLISGDEIQIKLQKALLKLPEKQRLVFNMRYYDELKFDEIAKITDTSVGALKASYHHAAKKIEEFITRD